MTLTRRSMFGGLVALAAPAIIRTPGLLMPIKPLYPALTFENMVRYQARYSNISRHLDKLWPVLWMNDLEWDEANPYKP